MKEAAVLQSTIEILSQYESDKKPIDQFCYTYFKNRRYVGSKDRQAILGYVYGIIRRRASCDWWALERGVSPLMARPLEAARIRVLTFLWISEKIPRDKIGILFSGEKYAPAKVSDKERAIFEKIPENPSLPPWVEGEFPEWLFPSLKRRFGENLKSEMQAFLSQASVDLRVNTLKTNRNEALKNLQSAGFSVNLTSLSPQGLRYEGRENITQSKAFQDGLIEVQDEGSQLIANLLDIKPGQGVLDLCAGAGGKTLAIAALLQNKGRVIATDTAEWRLKRAKQRLKRAGASNVELRVISGVQDKWFKRQVERFDGILVDAPCSGSGTWRRNPDQKWNISPQDIQELAALQVSLLELAACLLKPGGILVYATCSLLCEENEDVVASFLENHHNVEVIPCGLGGESFLALSPYKNNTDGFFAAKFKKKFS